MAAPVPTELLKQSGISSNAPSGGGAMLPTQLLSQVNAGTYISPKMTQPTPAPAPVSTQPTPAPKAPDFQTQVDNFLQGVQKTIQGFFTPQGGKPIPISSPKPATAPDLNLTTDQINSIATLKPGQPIPDFSSPYQPPSAQFKPGVAKGNIIDNAINQPISYLLNNTGVVGETIKKTASDIYNNPVEMTTPAFQAIKRDPAVKKAIQDNPIYKFETSALQGAMQGAIRVYANWDPKVQNFLDQEIVATGKKSDTEIAGNTVGSVVGTIGAFVLGGEVLAALKFGKVALPATFAALGQTSLPANTPVDARLRNLVVDTVSGTLLEYVKPLANLEKMGIFEKGVEYSKQLAKSLSILSTQTYLDARSVGASNEQALEMVKDSALVLLGIHSFMVAGKAGQYITRSQFKTGTAEFTPNQARSAVVGSDLENTKLGKAILKASLDAEGQGKNLQISISAAKQSPVAGALNLKTPQGLRVDRIDLVEPSTQQIAAPTVEKPAAGGESPVERLPVVIDQYKSDQGVNLLPSGEIKVNAPLAELTKLAETPEVKAMTEKQVADLPKNEDGTITLWRVGTIHPEDNRLISASLSQEAAQTFKEQHLETFGKDRPVTEITVKPEDVKIFIGGAEKEVLVQNPQSSSAVAIQGQEPTVPSPAVGGAKETTPLPSPTELPTPTQAPKEAKKPVVGRVGETYTLAPSEAAKSEEVMAEVAKLGLPSTVIKSRRPRYYMPQAGTGALPPDEILYNPPKIGLAEFKTFVKNSEEFAKNPVLVVDENKDLVFRGKNIYFKVHPSEAMQLSTEKLSPGDRIQVDIEKLTGKTQQMRVRNKTGEVMGFNPKNLEDPASPKATEEVKKIVKRSEIAKFLSEKLDVPIRRGKFRAGGALGIYKQQPKVVRVKSGGLQTIFHEVAHYLDDTIGFSKDLSVEERQSLMTEYANKYENDARKQEKEGFAEYMRFRMTGQTDKIEKWAPEFNKTFESKLNELPEIKDILETAAADYKRWSDLPATSKILSHISIGSTGQSPFLSRAIQFTHDLYTSALDDLHPLAEFEKLANKKLGKKLAAKEDPYILARNLRGWVGKADLFLNKGTFGKDFWMVDEKGKAKMNFTGKSYSEIMKPVEDQHALDDFRVYIVSQRIVNDLAPREIKTGVSVEDARTALEELDKKYPEFAKVAEERRAYKDALLEYAKDNGVIGEEGLKKIKELNKFHVPFYRVMEEVGTKFLGKTKIAGNISNPVKRIKGSEREIIDPLESDVKDTYAIINAADRNNIGIAMANVAKQNSDLGRLFEEVARPMKPVKVNAKEVLEKALGETGLAKDELPEFPEELADLVVTLFRPTYATGPNMLNVNMGDRQKVFEVDSDLFSAIQGLGNEDIAMIWKILSVPAKVLRAGATLSPDFSVRNPLRDQFTAFAYSKNGFIPGVDLVRGIWELLKPEKLGKDAYDLWKAGGGEHAMFVSLDRAALQLNLEEAIGSKKAWIKEIVKNPLLPLQILSEWGEEGTRLGEMRNALSRGKDPIEAAFDSRNVTLDFSRIGSKTRAVNAIIAFFNAQMQGTDVMIRNFKNRPFETLWKVMIGITLPSILLWLANNKDPRWKEIPQWQKDLFWIVMTKDHIYRIPKPFELGVLFGSVPERILDFMQSKDPEMLKELENNIAQGFTPGWMPTFMIPVIENISNYSFFMNRPIVSAGKENLPPPQQAGAYTSETAKVLGEALNYSPAKIDNLVRGYTGGLGAYTTAALDKILVGSGVVHTPPKPATKFEDLPVIKAFMVREPIGTGSESVNRVYDLYGTTNQEMTYVKQLVKAGHVDEAKVYAKKHPEVLNDVILSSAISTFSDLNKAVDEVRQSEKMTPQEKTKKIDLIQRLETNLAQKVLAQIKK